MDKYSIPVVFGLDEKYVFPAFVVIHSILKHSNEKYHFIIITADPVTELVEEYSIPLKTRYDNFSLSVRLIDQNVFENAQIHNRHLSIAAYFRLLIPDMLHEYDKCIYLDCDVLVNGNLAELFAFDLADNYIGGVKDCHIIRDSARQREHEKMLGIPLKEKYINSGVLLINIKKMRDDMLVRKFKNQIKKDNWYEDQDVLNVCCYPHIKILPLKYNVFHFYCGKSICRLYHLAYEKQDFIYEEPFIVHMGAEYKPWRSRKVKYADIWWNLAEIYRNTDCYQKYYEISCRGDDIEILFKVLEENSPKGFVIAGYSKTGRFLCDMMLAKGYNDIVAFMDNDKVKWGEEYRGIPVMGIKEILDGYQNIFWVISNQIHYEELRQQIFSHGFDGQCIVRFINQYGSMFYLLSLDERYYEDEIDRISEFEFAKEIPVRAERKRYLLQILSNPNLYKKEYEYLDQRYGLRYWYNVEYAAGML